MKCKVFALTGMVALLLWSCGNKSNQTNSAKDNTILQQDDGTLALNLDKAALYSDNINPSSNTAEWNFMVSKPGRYKVWLSSATLDTTKLRYSEPVRMNFLDKLVEVKPVCDKVVHNSNDVTYPYFRADSYMGSFYISEPGEYNIQIISEMVKSKDVSDELSQAQPDTRLMSVFLTPSTR
jgi:hypothetical protein